MHNPLAIAEPLVSSLCVLLFSCQHGETTEEGNRRDNVTAVCYWRSVCWRGWIVCCCARLGVKGLIWPHVSHCITGCQSSSRCSSTGRCPGIRQYYNADQVTLGNYCCSLQIFGYKQYCSSGSQPMMNMHLLNKICSLPYFSVLQTIIIVHWDFSATISCITLFYFALFSSL